MSNQAITFYHRFAYAFRAKQLELHEIVKFFLIAQLMQVIEGSKDKTIGYNVLDNSKLYDAMVTGILLALDGEPITLHELGSLIDRHFTTVGTITKRLVDTKRIEQVRTGRASRFIVSPAVFDPQQEDAYPIWIKHFTSALVALQLDPAFADAVAQDTKITFVSGMQVLKDEIREKFWYLLKSKQKEEQPKTGKTATDTKKPLSSF